MKKIALLSLTLLALSTTAYASSTVTTSRMGFGSTQIENKDLTTLHHSGELEVEKVKVTGSAIINGRFQALNSQFNELTINGQSEMKASEALGNTSINGALKVTDSKFGGSLVLNGLLEAKDSEFLKPVTITSTKIDFINCKVQSLLIKTTKEDQQQILTLQDTTINGDVTFESGNGLVKMNKNSKISGKVNGAKVDQ